MAKRGKAKQEEIRVEGFRSGLDFGKARALHLLRMMNEGFEDAIKDDELWHEVKLKEGENEMKAKHHKFEENFEISSFTKTLSLKLCAWKLLL